MTRASACAQAKQPLPSPRPSETPNARAGHLDRALTPPLPTLSHLPSTRASRRCEEGKSTNLMGGLGERIRLQKIEIPERPAGEKYDPVKAEKAWKDFFEKFPEMGAWEVTFKGDSEKSMEDQLVDTLEKSLARDKAEWEKPQAAEDW